MRKTALAIILLAAILFGVAGAVAPQKWTFRTYEEFLRGRFDGVSLTAEGVLSLAPREDKIEGPTEEFYLSFLAALDGSVYIGTGHSGRVFRIGKDGKGELYFQAQEMDVTSLALDSKGALYAGTAPNGKIYKITAKTQGTVFFDPAEKYIWDMMFDGNGNLLAAVGESGGIYEISPQGQGRLIFKAEENHILCLRRDRLGNLIAGSGGGGSVYRLAPGGRAQVVFETAYEEVRALALDAEGNILAAAGGTIRTKKEDSVVASSAGGSAEVSVSVGAVTAAPAGGTNPLAAAPASSRMPAAAAAAGKEPGALYRLSPDGGARKLWSSNDEMIYALNWNETDKRILFGTGPKGRLYALDREEKLSLVLQKKSEQIFHIAPAEARLYILANNPPQITAVYPEQRGTGEYLGPVLDARTLSAWGRLSWEAVVPQGAVIQVLSRSGNTAEPNSAWSDWSPPYQKSEGEAILSPQGRYLQIKVLMKTTSGRTTPALARLSAYYLQANTAPVVTRLELLNPNEVFLKPIDGEEIIWNLERRMPDAPSGRRDEIKFATAKRVERRGYQTVIWEAEDENGDALSYALWLKADGDRDWRLLDDRWTEPVYTFSTTAMPDGIYELKVTASDGPSNPPGGEKKGEKISPAFVIDNTPPVIRNFKAAKIEGGLQIEFQVEDQFSAVKDVRYLVRPDDWRLVFPEDGICDGKTESFKVKIPLPPGADRLLTLQVRDAVGNTAVLKQIF
jgi:hypothetical protein